MNLSWLGRLSPLFARLAGPKTLAALFLFCALPTGLGCAMFTPLAAPPDEPAHVARAEGLRLGQIMNSHVPSSYPAEPICARLFGCSMPPPLAALPDARAEGPSLDQPNSYPGVLIDSGMADLSRCLMRFVDLNHGHVPPSYLTCMRHARWSGQKIAFPTQMVEYFPVFYLPVTFAFWTG